MTDDQRLAEEFVEWLAQLVTFGTHPHRAYITMNLAARIRAAVAEERERCARLADNCYNEPPAFIATLIRGNVEPGVAWSYESGASDDAPGHINSTLSRFDIPRAAGAPTPDTRKHREK